MEGEFGRIIYCIDTSSLITIQRMYRLSVFPSLWDKMSELARSGRLVAPKEVLEELRQGGDDDICQWAENNARMFCDLDSEQAEVAKQIVNDPELRGLVDHDKETPEADPFVIALVIVRKKQTSLFPEQLLVVAEEHKAEPSKRPRIPNVCEKYDVECKSTIDMFEREGWQF